MTALAVGPLLDALRGVQWPARRRTPPTTAGAHASTLRGTTAEFTEYRAYRQGDDPRRIDWKLLARSDRAYLRITQEQATHPTLFVLDASASMAFPDGESAKWAMACRLVLGLAHVAVSAGDPVGLLVAGVPRASRPPRTRRDTVAALVRTLDAVPLGGDAPVAPLVAAPLRASRLVILTDLLGDSDALRRAAAERCARGVEVHLLHCIAREELDPPVAPRLAEDPERPGQRTLLASATRAPYQTAFATWRAAQARDWRSIGAVYREVVTDSDVESIIRAIVRRPVGARP